MSTSTARGLQGKRVFITSASQGIGKATALAFAAAGADVAINGRSAERLQPVVEAARKLGVRAVAIVGDLAVPKQWELVVQAAIAELGGLDVLINNGPGLDTSAPAADAPADSDPDSDASYESTFRVNVRAAAALMRHATPHLASNPGGGAIVNVSSALGSVPDPRMGAYCVAKAALQMLTQTWSLKLAKNNVRVNAVQPAYTLTPFVEGAVAAGHLNLEAMAASHPLGRIATSEEQANVIVFLASDAASFMTGAIVPVDGGALCTSWATAPQKI